MPVSGGAVVVLPGRILDLVEDVVDQVGIALAHDEVVVLPSMRDLAGGELGLYGGALGGRPVVELEHDLVGAGVATRAVAGRRSREVLLERLVALGAAVDLGLVAGPAGVAEADQRTGSSVQRPNTVASAPTISPTVA